MNPSDPSVARIAADLFAQAVQRFGPERAAVLRADVELVASGIARLLAEPLEPTDERPDGWPTMEADA